MPSTNGRSLVIKENSQLAVNRKILEKDNPRNRKQETNHKLYCQFVAASEI
jgi:hypothetical protein